MRTEQVKMTMQSKMKTKLRSAVEISINQKLERLAALKRRAPRRRANTVTHRSNTRAFERTSPIRSRSQSVSAPPLSPLHDEDYELEEDEGLHLEDEYEYDWRDCEVEL